MSDSSGQTMINEDIYVTGVHMNRKVCRFMTQALTHYWESHYTDDEIEWDDLKYIYEQMKDYGNSEVETLPCNKLICLNPDDYADCETCEYNPEYNKKLCLELGRTCIGERCQQVKGGVCQINPWLYDSSSTTIRNGEKEID